MVNNFPIWFSLELKKLQAMYIKRAEALFRLLGYKRHLLPLSLARVRKHNRVQLLVVACYWCVPRLPACAAQSSGRNAKAIQERIVFDYLVPCCKCLDAPGFVCAPFHPIWPELLQLLPLVFLKVTCLRGLGQVLVRIGELKRRCRQQYK